MSQFRAPRAHRRRPPSSDPFCYVCMHRVKPRDLTWVTLLDIDPTPMHVGCVDQFVRELEEKHPGLQLRRRWA